MSVLLKKKLRQGGNNVQLRKSCCKIERVLRRRNSKRIYMSILIILCNLVGFVNFLNFTSNAQEDTDSPIPIKMRKVISVDDIVTINIYSTMTQNSQYSSGSNAEQEFPVLLRPIAIRCTPPQTSPLNSKEKST